MPLNLRSFAPLLGAAMLALAGCQIAPQNPDTSAEPSAEQAAQAPDQSAAQAASDNQPPTAPALTPAASSHATFFIGETHSAPDLTAVKMTDGTRLYLQREPVLKGEDITQAHDLVDKQGKHFIGVRFTKAGASKLADVSAKSKGKRLVLILNGKVEAAPVIGEPLNHGVLAFSAPSPLGAANLAARIRGEQPPELKFKPAAKEAVQDKDEDESKSDPKADPAPQAAPESKAKVEPESKAEPRRKVEPKHKPEARRKTEAKSKGKAAPKHAVKAKANAAAKSQPAKTAAKPKSDAAAKKAQPAGSANP